MFRNNQKRFYESLEENNKVQPTELPNPKRATEFWRDICSEEVTHNEKAAWLKDVEDNMKHRGQQRNITITMNDVQSGRGKMANWKSASPDQVQGFWFKRLMEVRDRIVKDLQQCVTDATVPD